MAIIFFLRGSKIIRCAAAMMSLTKLVEGAAHDIFLPRFEDNSMCGSF
jgi:hypothetical protein